MYDMRRRDADARVCNYFGGCLKHECAHVVICRDGGR